MIIYIYIHIYILCTFNGTGDFIYPVVKGGGCSELGGIHVPYFARGVSWSYNQSFTKHNMIVIGIQWDIAGYIDQHTIGR